MKTVLIVGKFKGHGGVQTVHRDIFDAYKNIGSKVYKIDTFIFFYCYEQAHSLTKVIYTKHESYKT